MKKINQKVYKNILIFLLAAVFLTCSAGAASLGAWFIATVDQNQLRAEIPVGSLGAASLSLMGDPIPLGLSGDELLSLLELSRDQNFSGAEEQFKVLAMSPAQADHAYMDHNFGYQAYRLNYQFTYENNSDHPLDAYVRFTPSGKYANEVVPGIFALQMLTVQDQELERWDLDPDSAYYYPHPLQAGTTLILTYTVFLSDADFGTIHFHSLFGADLIQAANNRSALDWNVVINGDVSAYDDTLREIRYKPYDIDFAAPFGEIFIADESASSADEASISESNPDDHEENNTPDEGNENSLDEKENPDDKKDEHHTEDNDSADMAEAEPESENDNSGEEEPVDGDGDPVGASESEL